MTMIDLESYRSIVFFTGAGISAESGVSTYRGKGGFRSRYDYEEYACQEAFRRDYETLRCDCGNWLRPAIVWFGDLLDEAVMHLASEMISACDLFISIGTSGTVWPAAGYPALARKTGACCIEINLEPSGAIGYHLAHSRTGKQGAARTVRQKMRERCRQLPETGSAAAL